MMTNETVNNIGNFSSEALKVFDATVANGGGRLQVEGHGNSKEHQNYNKKLTPFTQGWLAGNNAFGRKIEPGQMTKPEAQELLRAINRDPELSRFNRGIYLRGVQQWLRRTPRRLDE